MIEAKNVYFAYSEKDKVLNDISFHIYDGENISLWGRNGSGKTTLLKLITRILKPTSGSITNSFKKVAYLTQVGNDESKQILSVKEVISLGIKYKPFSFMTKKDWEMVDILLKDLNLYELKNKKFDELSGGQKEKVRLLECLALKPDLLILDEWSTGIDEQSRKEIKEYILKYQKENGLTTIMVSHITEDFFAESHYFTINEEGKLEDGNHDTRCC